MIFTVIIYFIFAVLLFVVSVVDFSSFRIPNSLVVSLVALWVFWRVGLGVGSVIVGIDFTTGFLAPAPIWGVSFADAIIAAAILGGILLIATVIYEAITKKYGMGGGDIKLLAAVGLFLGIERGILCLLFACIVSLILALLVPRARWGAKSVVTEEGSDQPILRSVPFGPSIAIGTIIALIVV